MTSATTTITTTTLNVVTTTITGIRIDTTTGGVLALIALVVLIIIHEISDPRILDEETANKLRSVITTPIADLIYVFIFVVGMRIYLAIF